MINTLMLKQKEPVVFRDILGHLGSMGDADMPNERERMENRIVDMSFFEAFDAYLKYNGIISYTQDIIDAVDSIRAAEVKR